MYHVTAFTETTFTSLIFSNTTSKNVSINKTTVAKMEVFFMTDINNTAIIHETNISG